MAKKFSFSLEAVNKLRAYRADVSKNSFLQVSSVRIANDVAIDQILQLKDEIMSSSVLGTTLDEQLQARSHLKLLDRKIEQLSKERQRLIEIEDIKRKDYTGKLQEHEAIKIVKLKKFNQHKQEIQREETTMMEELALSRHQKLNNEL